MKRLFKNLKLRTKLLLGVGAIAFVAPLVVGVSCFMITWSFMKEETNRELTDKIQNARNLTESFLYSGVKNHLETRAQDVRKLLELYYSQVQKGQITKKEAISKVKNMLSNSNYGKIGDTGYFSLIGKDNKIIYHPKIEEDTDLSKNEVILKGNGMEHGYFEYLWKNPGEEKERTKAAGLAYFKPWQIVIWATSYRSEFSGLIDINSLRNILLSSKVGKSGYVFIINSKGDVIIHPTSEGKNIGNLTHIQKIIENRWNSVTNSLSSSYIQETDGAGNKGKKKLVSYQYIPDLDWIVVAGAYEYEFYESLERLAASNVVAFIVSFLIVISFGFFIARFMLKGIYVIQKKLKNISSGLERADLTKRLTLVYHDEIGELGGLIDNMLERLNGDLVEVEKTSVKIKDLADNSRKLIEKGATNLEDIKKSIRQIDSQTENSSSGIEELTATLEEMSRNIDSIMNSMIRQASAVEEGASSIEEMVRNIENTATMTKKTQDISNSLNSVANEGGTAVKTSIQSIREVSDYSQQILKLLGLITNIAKQTNLLAMNAAIEAAHAGEAGKGFAIVADEIRRLSEDTNKNAKDIGDVVGTIVGRIDDSVRLAEKAGIGLDMITAYSQQNVQIISSLNIAMAEQNNGAKEILKATQEIVKITEEVKISMTEQKAATDDFGDALRSLRDLSLENKEIIKQHVDDLNELVASQDKIRLIVEENNSEAVNLHKLVDRFILDNGEKGPESTAVRLVQ